MNNNNIPEIRFPGFSDAWEQRKCKELCSITTGKSNTQDQVKGGIYPFFIRSDITVSSNKYLYDCEAVITIGDGNIGKVFHYINGKFDLHQRCYKMADFNGVLGKYFYYFFSTKFYERAMKMTAKATVDSVRLEMISEMDICFPKSKEEQKDIAMFLTNLDTIITLQQRKLNSLKKLKKGMLQKMFPQGDANVPEIRFPGFTDAWEQRKLKDFCNITTGKLDANAMVLNGRYNFYTSGIDVFKIDKAAFVGPAITIAGNGANVGYTHLADGKFNAYQRTYVLSDFSSDRQFLNVSIGNKLPEKIQEEVRGSGIPYIVLNMLTDLVIPFPSRKEQAAIGAYFTGLDSLITLHQRKLNAFKKLKKGMLQKMFV